MDLALYYSPGACSQAAHIALEEAGLEFEARSVPLAEGANRAPDYLAINPRGFVPVLKIDNVPLFELAAILAFVASKRQQLAPEPGTIAHAKCMEWLAWMSSTFHVAYAQRLRPERFLPEGPERLVLTDYARGLLGQCNLEVEAKISEPWALGAAFSVVDTYIFPFYRWGRRNDFDMQDDCPRWTRHTEQMLQRPAVKAVLERERIPASAWIS